MKKPTSILFPGAMLAFGLIYAFIALGMPRGSVAQPGPGFFPVVVGISLIAASLACLLQELRGHGIPPDPPAASVDRRIGKTIQLTALMVGYTLALKPLGYPVAIGIFLLASIRIFGLRSWWATVGAAAIVTAVSYVVFILWLKVPMPLGIIEEVLG